MTQEDMGASADADRALSATRTEPEVSALSGNDPLRDEIARLRAEIERREKVVEAATKLLGAHPSDLGRAMFADSLHRGERLHNLYPSPAIERGRPVYMIVKYARGSYGVQKCRSAFVDRNTGEPLLSYEWIHPAGQQCRSRAEAVEWMRADAESRVPDYSKFSHRITCHEAEYFDQFGRPMADSALGIEAGTGETHSGSTEGESPTLEEGNAPTVSGEVHD